MEQIEKRNIKGYQSVYKCRLCNEKIKGPYTSNYLLVLKCMSECCLDGRSSEVPGIDMFMIHNCKDGNTGIADLQGVELDIERNRD